MSTAICTWFVADAAGDASFFPQVGARSDAPAAQAIYWRCAYVFYALSRRVNPGRVQRFFTNVPVPTIDGVDLRAAFAAMAVEVVTLPITYRLPRGSVNSWGNQFYILDILAWFAEHGREDRLIVLDSDCAWRLPADEIERAIDRHGCLTYEMDAIEYPPGAPINGLTREGMGRFAGAAGPIPYCGGEIFAGSVAAVRALATALPAIWARVLAGGVDAPMEEAHLLSVLYAQHGYATGTADPFIRRMWTAFKHNNLRDDDRRLAIWHLPSEKRSGFEDLFRQLKVSGGDAATLDDRRIERALGFPRRTVRKLVRDGAAKLVEKLGR